MVSAIRSGPRAARSGDPSTGGTGRCPPARQEQSRTRQDHLAQASAPARAASRSADRSPGFGDIGASALSGRKRSAGEQRVDEIRWRWVPEYQQNNPACTRSQNPPHIEVRLRAGLPQRRCCGPLGGVSPRLAGIPAAGPGPCSPGRSESPARPTSWYRWCCCHPGRPDSGQPHRRRPRLGHRPDQARAHPAQ
jgi:hypothetical protein